MAQRIGIIGGGAMGSALARGIVTSGGFLGENIFIGDPHSAHNSELHEKFGVRLTTNNLEVVKEADVLVLAVKPYTLPVVLDELGALVNPNCLVISVVAGKTISVMEAALPVGTPIIRAMPNSASQVRTGACAIAAGSSATEEHMKSAEAIFGAVGTSVRVAEGMLDAVTALSGSGPAYVYLMIEALIDGGVKVGLPREIAAQLAAQTVLGSARMIQESGRHPAELKDMVATPGGTTIAALASLEQAGVRAALMQAVEKAWSRAVELGS